MLRNNKVNIKNNQKKQTLGYLSGAPRVSTRKDAETTGPKSHIIGVIKAFNALEWEVRPFIVGDRMPKKLSDSNSRSLLSKNFFTRIVADLLRIIMSKRNATIAFKEIGEVDYVYERFGTFQNLGNKFQKHDIPWILETNGPFFKEASEQRRSLVLKNLAKKIELKAYRDCDLLICISYELKKIIVEETGLLQEKIFVLPNGVDINHFNPETVNANPFFNFPVIGYVGALLPRQGLSILLDVIAELNRSKIFVGVVIIGEGPEKQRLLREVIEYKIEDRVRITGLIPREKIPEMIAGFDLGYSGQIVMGEGYLSRMYHSPLKLYEYLAMGKPVIASKFDDADRLLSDTQLGYLFQAGSKEALKDAIIRAIKDKENWQSMGKKARQMIVMKHSWEVRVNELIQRMEQIKRNKIIS